MIFETERLVIRNYRNEDRPVFAAIAGNPQTRIYHTGVVTPAESDDGAVTVTGWCQLRVASSFLL